jgi:hypothetical protein
VVGAAQFDELGSREVFRDVSTFRGGVHLTVASADHQRWYLDHREDITNIGFPFHQSDRGEYRGARRGVSGAVRGAGIADGERPDGGPGLLFEDRGEHELKGVPDRWRLYRVVS